MRRQDTVTSPLPSVTLSQIPRFVISEMMTLVRDTETENRRANPDIGRVILPLVGEYHILQIRSIQAPRASSESARVSLTYASGKNFMKGSFDILHFSMISRI